MIQRQTNSAWYRVEYDVLDSSRMYLRQIGKNGAYQNSNSGRMYQRKIGKNGAHWKNNSDICLYLRKPNKDIFYWSREIMNKVSVS